MNETFLITNMRQLMDNVDCKVASTCQNIENRISSTMEKVSSTVASHLDHLDKTIEKSINEVSVTIASLSKSFNDETHPTNAQNERGSSRAISPILSVGLNNEWPPEVVVDPRARTQSFHSALDSLGDLSLKDINPTANDDNYHLDEFLKRNTVEYSGDQPRYLNLEKSQPSAPNPRFTRNFSFKSNLSTHSQLAQVSVPLLRPALQKKFHNLMRHVVFKDPPLSVNYLHLYANGLLSGPLAHIPIVNNLTNLDAFHGHSLNPILKQVFELDNTLLLELVSNWQPPTFKLLPDNNQGRASLFLEGLASMCRHLGPISQACTTMSNELNESLTCAQAMILVRDKISIIKLSANDKLLDVDFSMMNDDGLKSRTAGSIATLNWAIMEWLSII